MHSLSRAVRAVEWVMTHEPGALRGIFLEPNTGAFSGTVSLGGRGDSYYEYLLKYFLITGKADALFEKEYRVFMNQLRLHLLDRAQGPLGLIYVAELENLLDDSDVRFSFFGSH